MLIGRAKPTPSVSPNTLALVMPTMAPSSSISGPPLLPGLIPASC